jgi:3D (Asp-Asp-Asp) domain-containing protein
MKGLLALTGLLATALPALGVTALLLSISAQDGTCQPPGETPSATAPASAWTATAYGPPWGGTQGDGITTTGLNLTTGPPAYEIAVDPNLIPLGSYVHITPNPFATTSAFYAGDTGSAITGRHIDIYDWYGRANQNAWGHPHRHHHTRGQPRRRQPPRRRRTHTHHQRTGQMPGHRHAQAHRRPNRAHPIRRQRHRAPRRTHPRQARDRRRQPDPHPPLPRTRPALRHPHPTLARLRLLRRYLLRPLRRRAPQPHRPRLKRTRELRATRPRTLDHHLRQQHPHLDRHRRHRTRHRQLRRTTHPRRHRATLAHRTTRQPQRRHELRRSAPDGTMSAAVSGKTLAPSATPRS